MVRVFLLVTLLIVYGSLYPWQFHAAQQAGNPLGILFHSWPDRLDRFLLMDIPVNVLLYVPFGVSAFLALSRVPRAARLALAVLLAVVLSAGMEITQLFDDHRVCSALDLAMNVTGAALGALAASLWVRSGRSLAISAQTAAPVLLLSCWILALTFPFMPDMSRTHLREKLAYFPVHTFSPASFLAAMAEWSLAGRLLPMVWPWDEWLPAYCAMFFLLPARFLIVHTEPHWTNFAGALAGGLLCWLLARSVHRDGVLCGVALASIGVTGLAPYTLAAHAQPFFWMPFVSLFRGDWERGFSTLLHKALLYGAAVWTAVRAGARWWHATAAVAALLALIEVVQMHLPNHIAESTDPLLAVLMTLILKQDAKAGRGTPAR